MTPNYSLLGPCFASASKEGVADQPTFGNRNVGDVMAENLLRWMPYLTETDRKEITNAMRNHDPSRRVIDYNDLATIGLLTLENVIAALLEVYRHYGTAKALGTARKLQSKPFVHQDRDGPVP